MPHLYKIMLQIQEVTTNTIWGESTLQRSHEA
jgi:hypothetical protein